MKTETVDPSILEAIGAIKNFITETTGKAPTPEELADSLKRYFVMNEIKDHILMVRQDSESGTESG
ncbi:MAG: hypothetical protein R6X10_10410 [Desulfobacterales bacterium]